MSKHFKGFALTVLMLFAFVFTAFGNAPVVKADGKELTEVKLGNITITDDKGNSVDQLYWWSKFQVNIEWDAQSYDGKLEEGDYFVVNIPGAMKIPDDFAVRNFPLKNEDGVVVANAVIDAPNGFGGTIKVTFTDFVKDHIEVKGTLRLSSEFSQENIIVDQVNPLRFTTDDDTETDNVHIVGPVELQDEVVQKWVVDHTDNTVKWSIRLNHAKQTYTDVNVKDKLMNPNGSLDGLVYIQDSFRLYEVEYDAHGKEISRTLPGKDISADVVLSENNTVFNYYVGDLAGKQYLLEYESTYVPGVQLDNAVYVDGKDITPHTAYTYYRASSGGGTGQGILFGSIKVTKVNHENPAEKLAGATFTATNTVTRAVYTATTDTNGEAFFRNIPVGTYVVKETAAPAGFVMTTETQETTLTQDERDKALTFTNESAETSISVLKEWEGTVADSAEIILHADGTEVARVTLNHANQWQHTFTGLQRFNAQGQRIVYTVTETLIPGYDVTIAGDPTAGFTIVNKQTTPNPPPSIPTDPANPTPPGGQTPPPGGQTPPPGGQTPPPAGQTPPPSGQTPPPSGQTPPPSVPTPPNPGIPTNPSEPGRPNVPQLPYTGVANTNFFVWAAGFSIAGVIVLVVGKNFRKKRD